MFTYICLQSTKENIEYNFFVYKVSCFDLGGASLWYFSFLLVFNMFNSV